MTVDETARFNVTHERFDYSMPMTYVVTGGVADPSDQFYSLNVRTVLPAIYSSLSTRKWCLLQP